MDAQGDTSVDKKERPSEDREKAAICKPRREASEETNPADSSVLAFPPPESRDNKFLWFKAASLWHFVRAAGA